MLGYAGITPHGLRIAVLNCSKVMVRPARSGPKPPSPFSPWQYAQSATRVGLAIDQIFSSAALARAAAPSARRGATSRATSIVLIFSISLKHVPDPTEGRFAPGARAESS